MFISDIDVNCSSQPNLSDTEEEEDEDEDEDDESEEDDDGGDEDDDDEEREDQCDYNNNNNDDDSDNDSDETDIGMNNEENNSALSPMWSENNSDEEEQKENDKDEDYEYESSGTLSSESITQETREDRTQRFASLYYNSSSDEEDVSMQETRLSTAEETLETVNIIDLSETDNQTITLTLSDIPDNVEPKDCFI